MNLFIGDYMSSVYVKCLGQVFIVIKNVKENLYHDDLYVVAIVNHDDLYGKS